MNYSKVIMITGGAGFIGSHVIKRFVKKYPNYLVINVDCLTYAGNLDNLIEIENQTNYRLEKMNIVDKNSLEQVMKKYQVSDIINLAAESHVDNSIKEPIRFVETNVLGTVNLLQLAKSYWPQNSQLHRFYQVSTDEVYGSLGETGFFTETSNYQPNSPYSASKASADHFVRAYGETFNLNYLISNCSNNYGPNHYPEKLIPLTIQNIINMKPVPVYGDGLYTRDWLYVEDHAEAIDLIFHNASSKNTYNIGGNNEWKNIDLIKRIASILDDRLNRPTGESAKLIHFVTDRPGHDRRYAIDASKLKKELNWQAQTSFEIGIAKTIDWYLANPNWIKNIINRTPSQ